MIIKDEILLAEFRAKSHCEWCKRYCPGELDANHVFCRGMGGGSRLDVRINLTSLCRWWCHPRYTDGEITRDEMLAVVAHRERLTVDEIVAEIRRLMRLAKVWTERPALMARCKHEWQALLKARVPIGYADRMLYLLSAGGLVGYDRCSLCGRLSWIGKRGQLRRKLVSIDTGDILKKAAQFEEWAAKQQDSVSQGV